MGVATVLRDDLRNVHRSYVVLGVICAFAVIVGLIFAAEMDVYDDAYRTLFDVSVFVAFVFPLFVAPLTYAAIAGDRAGGSIKYFLGLPNNRFAYFLGKYISRVTVAVTAVLVGTLVGFVVAAATFDQGADPIRFLKFTGASALYAVAIAATFVGLSALTVRRSRAMVAVLGAYFVLAPFWTGFLPVFRLTTLLDTIESVLGITVAESSRALIASLSPTAAYFGVTETVYAGVFDRYPVFGNFNPENELLAHEPWFTALVLIGWATIVPLAAFLVFRDSELG